MSTWLIDTNGDWVFTIVGCDSAPDLPCILGDPVQLQRITLNLIVDGIEAMSGVTDRLRDLLIRSGQYEPGPSGRRRANSAPWDPAGVSNLDGCTSTVAMTLRSSPRSFRLLAARFYSAHAQFAKIRISVRCFSKLVGVYGRANRNRLCCGGRRVNTKSRRKSGSVSRVDGTGLSLSAGVFSLFKAGRAKLFSVGCPTPRSKWP